MSAVASLQGEQPVPYTVTFATLQHGIHLDEVTGVLGLQGDL